MKSLGVRSTQRAAAHTDYQGVYREGMDTNGLEPEGAYVGASNGQLYASIDGGDCWQRLPGTFPRVLSVTCAVVYCRACRNSVFICG